MEELKKAEKHTHKRNHQRKASVREGGEKNSV
jgi:hypothetical protein